MSSSEVTQSNGGESSLKFEAGMLTLNPSDNKTLGARPDKGWVIVSETRLSEEDSAVTFVWEPRTTRDGNDDDDDGVLEREEWMIFPGEAEIVALPHSQSKTGRVFVIKFNSSSRRLFFWFQYGVQPGNNPGLFTSKDKRILDEITIMLSGGVSAAQARQQTAEIHYQTDDDDDDEGQHHESEATTRTANSTSQSSSTQQQQQPPPPAHQGDVEMGDSDIQANLRNLVSSIVVPPSQQEASSIQGLQDLIPVRELVHQVEEMTEDEVKQDIWPSLPEQIKGEDQDLLFPASKMQLISILQSPQFAQAYRSFARLLDEESFAQQVARDLNIPYIGPGAQCLLSALQQRE